MHRIQCAQIWGGIRNQDQDVSSAGIVATLYSASCDGGKGGDIYYLSVCESDMLTRVAIADVVGHGQAVSDVSQDIYDALAARMNDADFDQQSVPLSRGDRIFLYTDGVLEAPNRDRERFGEPVRLAGIGECLRETTDTPSRQSGSAG